MVGPPGAGKTLLAHLIPSILPRLSIVEALEVMRVCVVADQLLAQAPPIRQPPIAITIQRNQLDRFGWWGVMGAEMLEGLM